VAEEFLAAEVLVIRVLQPAVAQAFIRKIVHMLKNSQTRHQSGRQWRPARQVGVNRSHPLVEEVPINRARQFGQCVSRIDDLIQPGPQKVVLAAIARFPWSHRCPQNVSKTENHNSTRRIKSPENFARPRISGKNIRQENQENID
jgi:hypothetical protein